MGGVYFPRSPTTGVLYGVVRGYWSDFAAEVRDRTDGDGLPAFVSEFRKFLRAACWRTGSRGCAVAIVRSSGSFRSVARAAVSARAAVAGEWPNGPLTSL